MNTISTPDKNNKKIVHKPPFVRSEPEKDKIHEWNVSFKTLMMAREEAASSFSI